MLFNSNYNQTSFFHHFSQVFKHQPTEQKNGYSLQELRNLISTKSKVIYYPLVIPPDYEEGKQRKPKAADEPLHILWNHRWEWDKNPDAFFAALIKLKERKLPFIVSVIGEYFEDIPECFIHSRQILAEGNHIHKWGFLESKDEYYELLSQCDIVVSTAIHEVLLSLIQIFFFPFKLKHL